MAKDKLKESRNETTIREYEMENAETTDYPGNFPDTYTDDIWDFDKFIENFQVKIIRIEGNELEFDMIGINPAIANAFRRILLAEVPTVAIEKVEIYNNTSLFQDDFLAHRLGLIPLYVDPCKFNYPKGSEEYQNMPYDPEKEDSIVFELKMKCTKGKDKEIINRSVYSKSLVWKPLSDEQKSKFSDEPKPVNDDILIAKLSPGQELDLRLVCAKGIGRDHAKFSPVCTASYRLLPKIELLRDVVGDDAQLLQESFSPGVIDVIDAKDGKKKIKKAVVRDARNDMCSRNIYRHEHLKDAVRMGLVKDHFIFTIESTGALPPNELLKQAIDILIEKCEHFIEELADVKRT